MQTSGVSKTPEVCIRYHSDWLCRFIELNPRARLPVHLTIILRWATVAPKKLTESIIQAGAEAKSFQRGQALYHDGAISNAFIQGNLVAGDCAGTQAPFYRVRVELDDAGIRTAS